MARTGEKQGGAADEEATTDELGEASVRSVVGVIIAELEMPELEIAALEMAELEIAELLAAIVLEATKAGSRVELAT